MLFPIWALFIKWVTLNRLSTYFMQDVIIHKFLWSLGGAHKGPLREMEQKEYFWSSAAGEGGKVEASGAESPAGRLADSFCGRLDP